ncbi:conserved hypothetical protein [Flavobacterium psychrophilum]|nr:conserved hypothetical protein [Flavobacterium psychrophilum]
MCKIFAKMETQKLMNLSICANLQQNGYFLTQYQSYLINQITKDKKLPPTRVLRQAG